MGTLSLWNTAGLVAEGRKDRHSTGSHTTLAKEGYIIIPVFSGVGKDNPIEKG